MFWFRLIALVLAVAADHSAPEGPQLCVADGQLPPTSCQQVLGAALLQQRVLFSGSRQAGEGAPFTFVTDPSVIAATSASATVSSGSSLQQSAPASKGVGAGEDAAEDVHGLPVSQQPSDQGLDFTIISGQNRTSPTVIGNESIMNSSTTRIQSSAVGSKISPTASPSTNLSSTNSSMTVNITVSKRGHAETRVKRCHNGICKVHNRTWHTDDSDEASNSSANSSDNLSNLSDVLRWLDDVFKAPTESSEGFPDGFPGELQPFSGGAGGFAPGGAQWHDWDDSAPDSGVPSPLHALTASMSGGFLQPWLQGSEVGLSGQLPWGLRSRDLIVDRSGHDVIVAYHLDRPEKLEIRQVVALTQVPRGEPLQMYDDTSGRFELRWPCGYGD